MPKKTTTPAISEHDAQFVKAIAHQVKLGHRTSKQKGFHDAPRNNGEDIALIHSELSEALDALRHGNPPDQHCPTFPNLNIELADAVIRIFDMSGRLGIDLGHCRQDGLQQNTSSQAR